MPDFEKSQTSNHEWWDGQHRFEHWYRDNQVYFITARCRDRFAAFATEQAKLIFWTQFEKYTKEFGFVPWVTSLLDNHYHTLGYLYVGANPPEDDAAHPRLDREARQRHPRGPTRAVLDRQRETELF